VVRARFYLEFRERLDRESWIIKRRSQEKTTRVQLADDSTQQEKGEVVDVSSIHYLSESSTTYTRIGG